MNDILAPLNSIPKNIYCASDYESLAHRFIAPDRLAYIQGGSGVEATLKSNFSAFNRCAVYPRLFSDLNGASTELSLLNQYFEHPIMLAPVAHQKLIHSDAELATASGANATNSCMIASTLSSVTLEKIANQVEQRWFQLYFQETQEHSARLVQRAIDAGYQALVVTLDGAIQAPSHSSLRADFRFPSELTAANFNQQLAKTQPTDIFAAYRKNSPDLKQLASLIEHSPIPVVVKGVMHKEDAIALKKLGAKAIVVSNHGGRTIDGAPASLAVLREIRSALGEDYPLLFDSGVRSGSDVFKALALGANAVLIGRLQLYALSVAGALGVAHMLKLLRQELELCMAQAGCACISDINNDSLYSYESK